MEELLRLIKTQFLSLLTSLIGTIFLLAAPLIPKWFATPENALLWAKLSLLLIAISLYVLAWTIYLSKKLKNQPDFSDYISDPKRGLLHKNNNMDRICPACRSNNRKTQMQIMDNGYWVCPHSEHQNPYAG